MHPISELLCDAYSELYKQNQVKFPLYEEQKVAIDSVVKTVHATYFGFERYPTPIDKAVAYLCLIIKDHVVTDGNKRLAILWFRIYCVVNKLEVINPDPKLDVLAVAIEKEKELSLDKIMELVRKIIFSK